MLSGQLHELLLHVLHRRAEQAELAAIGRPKSWDEYQRILGRIAELDGIREKIETIAGVKVSTGPTGQTNITESEEW